MAEGGPLERQDLVTDDALKAPGILTEEFQKLLDKLDDVVKKSQEYGTAFTTAEASTTKLKESTIGLSDEQKVLGQIQVQIATLTAKQSDEYIEQVNVVNNLKQTLKEKTQLGDRDAQSVNAQNSSIKQLGDALNANRVAYSNLRTEQERQSTTGKELLKTIQDQDKAFKDLKNSVGQNQEKVGGYKGELEGLLGKFGEFGNKAKEGFGIATEAAGGLFGVLGAGIAIVAALGETYIKSAAGVKDFEEAESRASNSFQIFANLIGGSSKGEGEGIMDRFARGVQAGGLALMAVFTGSITLAEALDKAIQKAQKSSNTLVELKFKDLEISHELAMLQLEANKARGDTNDPDKNVALVAANKYVDALQKRMVLEKAMQEADRAAFLQHQLDLGNDILSEKNITNEKAEYLRLNNLVTETEASNQRLLDRALKTQASITAELLAQEKAREKSIDDSNKKDDDALTKLITDQNAAKTKNLEQDLKDADNIIAQWDADYEKKNEDEIKRNQKEWETYLNNKLEAAKVFKKKEEDLNREMYAREAELARSTISAITVAVTGQYQSEAQDIQSALNNLQIKYQEESQMAGNNAAAKLAIDAQYNKDQAKLQAELAEVRKKQAIFEKAAAILDIGVKTAQAIADITLRAEALAAIPIVGDVLAAKALAQIPLVVATGAAQIAAVAAKPLPSYELGTKNHKGGLARVGEAGSELYLTPSGLAGLTPSRETIMNLPQGTQVFTNSVTRMLALQGLGIPERLDRAKQLDTQVVKELRQTNNLLSRKQTSFVADGVALIQVMEKQKGLIQRIRSSVMLG